MSEPDCSSPPDPESAAATSTAATSTTTVSTTAAAQALVRPAERRFLEPFVGRELAPAEAARELGVAVEQMAYRVRALAGKDLLTATRTQPRGGRAVTYYRAAAEIRAPVLLLPEADTRSLFEILDAAGRTAFLDALAAGADRSGLRDWLVRLHRSPGGTVELDLVPDHPGWSADALLADAAPPVLFHWAPLRLSRDKAKDLQRDLSEVLSRYAAESEGPGAPDHLLGLFLTPLSPR
ncbi:hypothetical protein [Pseudonocardia humida]|uniref:ArsR family transcriptional regulator n=1 Tax=Pseudonocardia humida TaxID=2800819 RepID=A0ABT1AAP4_9PSEU|nr:hypothetical protein [Pseudonocardia humida]MCO1659879.1 hypothetical protein [Pseudonocardia humida]